jgi:hypothetical protein
MDWGDNDPVVGAAPAPASVPASTPSWGSDDKPVASTSDKVKEALGATGKQPYGEGAGYLIDNPITRGLAQAGNSASTGFNELLNRVFVQPVDATVNALGGHSNLTGAFNQAMVEPGVANAQNLAAPASAGIGSAGVQTVANLGGSIATAMAGGGADTAAPQLIESAPTLGRAISAGANGLRIPGVLGATSAGDQAATLDANGQPVSNAQLANMALANTAANALPMGHGLPLVARPVVGAASGLAGKYLSDQATGQHSTPTDYATSAGLAAMLGMLPGGGEGAAKPEVKPEVAPLKTASFGADDPVAPDLGHAQQDAPMTSQVQAATPAASFVDPATQAAQDAAQSSTAHATSGATAAGLVAKNAAEAGLSPQDIAAHTAAAEAMVKADPDAEVPLHPATPIDATGSVPLGGGGSTDNSVNFIDKRIPQFVDVPNDDGQMVKVDAHDVIANAHEAPEKTQLDEGKDYADAHNVNANTYEEAYLREKYGVSHEAFNKVMQPFLDQAEAEGAGASDIPAKLDPKPYIDDGVEHLLQPKSGADITQALGDKLSDMPAAAKEYSEIPETKGGTVLSTDVARELSPDYLADRTRSAATHEPSSAFIKRLYADKLAQPTPAGMDPIVRFTAGGTGAGKTTGLDTLQNGEKPEITYDTNMNKLSSSEDKVEQALQAGRKVQIIYVYRDPVDALVNGALPRASRQEREFGTGRTVPLAEHVKTHVGVRPVMDALAEKYKNNPDVEIIPIDNSRGKDNARPVDLADVPRIDDNGLHEKLRAALDTEHQAGRISDATHAGFSGERVEEKPGSGVRGQSQPQRDGGTPPRPESAAPLSPDDDYAADQHLARMEQSAVSPADRSSAIDSLEIPVAPEDHAEALSIADLVDRAIDAGVSDKDIIAATAIGTTAERARKLWDLSYQAEQGDAQTTPVPRGSEGGDQPPNTGLAADHGNEQAQVPGADSEAKNSVDANQRPAEPDGTADPVARSETTGIKNATVAEERAFKGKDEVDYEGKRTFGDAWDEASKKLADDPSHGQDLARAIIEKPRPLSGEESAALIQDRMRLHNTFREANGDVERAMDAGDANAEAQARARLRTVEDALEINDQASRVSGYEQGFGLAARRMMSRPDYTMADLITRGKVAAGRELSVHERAQIERLAKMIEEKDAQIAELQKQRAQRKAGTSGAQRKTADQHFKDLSEKLKAIREADQLLPGCVV